MLSDSNFLLIHILLTTHSLNYTLIISEILEFIDNQLPCLVLQKKKFFGNSLVVQWLELSTFTVVQFSSVQFSLSVVSDSLRPHESQHTRPPCPSPTPRVHSNSCPSGRWCHPAISSSVVPFSSCPQSLPASESFPISQLFAWGGQSTGVSASASVLPMNTQDWSPLGWTGWISLQSKGLSRVFSNTTVQKHQGGQGLKAGGELRSCKQRGCSQ